MLTLVVTPARGTQTTQVLINNEVPNYSYATDVTTMATSTLPLFTLRVPISDAALETGFFSYAVRGATFATDTALTVTIDEDGNEATVPAYSWAYSPYTTTRYIAAEKPTAEVSADPSFMATPVGDARVNEAVVSIRNTIPGVEEDDISVASLKTSLAFLLALVAGGVVTAAVSSKTGGLSPIALFPGTLVFCMGWSILGPMLFQVPWPVALPPLLLPPIFAFLALGKRF